MNPATRVRAFLVSLVVPLLSACASVNINDESGRSIEATEESYAQHRHDKGVLLLSVNWGRAWGCGPYENAELRGIGFDRLPASKRTNEEPADILLYTGPNILRRPGYVDYALLVEPGEYVLAGFLIKVAVPKIISAEPIQYLAIGREHLSRLNKGQVGYFSVSSGETVYIGHFDVKCTPAEPMLWRVRVKKGKNFEDYLSGVKNKYKFLETQNVSYRLFNTLKFGPVYERE